MTTYDVTTAKIRQLPETLAQEANDFIDFLLLRHNNTRWQMWTLFSETLESAESDLADYLPKFGRLRKSSGPWRNQMVTLSRGDLVLCDLNPVMGTEQAGIRPAVILQINSANAASPHTIIAPFTTKIRHTLCLRMCLLQQSGGLNQDSVVLCEQSRD